MELLTIKGEYDIMGGNISENSKIARELVEKIYNDLDMLNGYLHEVVEDLEMDDELYSRLNFIWMMFPTFSTLDELKSILREVEGRSVSVVKINWYGARAVKTRLKSVYESFDKRDREVMICWPKQT